MKLETSTINQDNWTEEDDWAKENKARNAILDSMQSAIQKRQRPLTIFVRDFKQKSWAESLLKSLGRRFRRDIASIYFAVNPEKQVGSFYQNLFGR